MLYEVLILLIYQSPFLFFPGTLVMQLLFPEFYPDTQRCVSALEEVGGGFEDFEGLFFNCSKSASLTRPYFFNALEIVK